MNDLERALAEATALQPGAVIAVLDGGVSLLATGHVDLEKSAALSPDAVFRIASLTKPITAAALVMLMDEHGVALSDPVARWLPELADPQILISLGGELDQTVPARREITVEDVLTSRMGTGIVPAAPGSTPIQREIERLQIVGFGPPDPSTPMGQDEWIGRLGALPLLAQPGDRWFYSVSSNVQGVLASRLAGAPLSQVLQERIFAPLGMNDTGFHVRSEQASRFTPAYSSDLTLSDDPAHSPWGEPPVFEGGEGGLVSTAADYMAFVRMLHAGGDTSKGRMIDEAWIRRMFSDHLTDEQRADAAYFLDGRGWGYGLSVDVDRTAAEAMTGQVGWAGGLGTSWLSNLQDQTAVVVLCARALDDPEVYASHLALHEAALTPGRPSPTSDQA